VDNGSKDETPQIIEDFFKEHDVPGKLYHSKIGWVGHGINRQHSWDFLTDADHGCDYILRVDADELLEVDDNFNWDIIKTKDAWRILYMPENYCTRRMWMWSAKKEWAWKNDVAHETIYIKNGDFERGDLPQSFRHNHNEQEGRSTQNPIKFIQDVLRLENQLLERFRDGGTLENEYYHLEYLCKSFNYTRMWANDENNYKYFPFGKDNLINFLERGVFYWTKLIEYSGGDFYKHWKRGELYKFLLRWDEAFEDWEKSFELKDKRAEALYELFERSYYAYDWEKAFNYGSSLMKIKCPFPEETFCIEFNKYPEHNWRIHDMFSIVCHQFGMKYDLLEPVLESKRLAEEILKRDDILEEDRERLKQNIYYFEVFIDKKQLKEGNELNKEKLDLIDMSCKGKHKIAELGGVHGVNCAYGSYARNKYSNYVITVDSEWSDEAISLCKSNNVRIIKDDFGNKDVPSKIGKVDVIILFDVLLHQVSPNWDEIIKMYAPYTDTFVIYNPQYKSDKTVRLMDLSKEEYYNIVPINEEANLIIDEVFDKKDEINPSHKKPWKDIHNVWQWGITDEDIIKTMKRCGFKQTFHENYGSWNCHKYFDACGFIFNKNML
jgi:glycosyltransferase involved in cell wall biosynthesis